jgi:hypothetical protein
MLKFPRLCRFLKIKLILDILCCPWKICYISGFICLKVTVRLMHNETYYNHTMPMIFTVILVEYCSRYIIEINIFYAKESNILFFSVHIKPEI